MDPLNEPTPHPHDGTEALRAAIEADDPDAFAAARAAFPGFRPDDCIVARIENYSSGTKHHPSVSLDACNCLKYAVDRRAARVAQALLADPSANPNPCFPRYGWPAVSMAIANGDIGLAGRILDHPNFDLHCLPNLNSMGFGALENGRSNEGREPDARTVREHCDYAERYVRRLGPDGAAWHSHHLVRTAASSPEHGAAVSRALASFGTDLPSILPDDKARLLLVEECWSRHGPGKHLADLIPESFYSLLTENFLERGQPELLGFFMSEETSFEDFGTLVGKAPGFIRAAYARDPVLFSYAGAEHLDLLETIGVSPFDEPDPRPDRPNRENGRNPPRGIDFVAFSAPEKGNERARLAREAVLDRRLPEILGYAAQAGIDLNRHPDILERAIAAGIPSAKRGSSPKI